MDLICSKYSSPFLFIDNCILAGTFFESIEYLIEQKNRKEAWEMYLASLPFVEVSFEEFYKGSTKKKVNETITKEKAEKIAEDSQNILSGFIPPQ